MDSRGKGRGNTDTIKDVAAQQADIGFAIPLRMVRWESDAIPQSIRRPWCVFEQDIEDKLDDESSQGADVSVEIRNTMDMIRSQGLLAAYAALSGEFKEAYAEVSLMELSAFLRWHLHFQSSGTPCSVPDGEAWDLLEDEEKANWISEDPYWVLSDPLWSKLSDVVVHDP
jgi:hypothetical protein